MVDQHSNTRTKGHFLTFWNSSAGFCWWKDSSSPVSEGKYDPTKKYVYKYESQVFTGLPTFSRQYAGIKIVADAVFTYSSPATLQLENVEVMSLNRPIQEVRKLPPTEQLSLKDFIPLDPNDNRLIAGKLQQLIKFKYDSYENFKVAKLAVCTEETNWSIDIKRGILAMIQVKLQADDGDYVITEKLPYNDLEKEHVTTFDTLEPAADGNCYSSLHVYTNNNASDVFQVIKARDHSRCLKVNVIEKNTYPQRQINCNCRNNMKGELCACKPMSNVFNSTNLRYDVAKTVYSLQSSDKKDFILKDAIQTVETRIETPHTPHEHLLTVSNQTLLFREIRSHSSRSQEVCPTFKQVEQPWMLRVLLDSEEKPMMTREEIKDKVKKMLEELATIVSQISRFDDQMGVFFQLMDNIRLLNQDDLGQIFSSIKPSNDDASYKKWKLYIDALKEVNTTAADDFLLNKMLSEEIGSQEAISVMLSWTTDKVPTQSILDKMMQKFLPALQSKTFLYQHAALAFGSMVRRFIHSEEMAISRCILPVDKEFHQRRIESCRKYEKYVERRLHVANHDDEKIMLLKTVANLGSIKTLPMIQSFMVDTESKAVRVHAIWAVKNMGFQNQRKVIQTLTPIMLQHHADSELRIAAFVMLMRCNPTASLLEIERYINSDPDREYKTFVVQYMRNMLETEQPECENCNMRVRQVLKSIRAFRFSYLTTDFQIKYGLRTSDGYGDMFRVSTVGKSSTPYPQATSIQHFTGNSHQWNHLWEIGYTTEGMDKLFEKLMGKPSAGLYRQSARDISQYVKQRSSGETKPSVTLFIRVLGQQISFVHLDENTLASLIQMGVSSGNRSIEVPLKIFNTMLTTPKDIHLLQPSGFMLNNLLTHINIVDIDGKVKVEFPLGKLPVVTFNTNKPIRFEVRTCYTQQTQLGFATTGLVSNVVSRAYIKAGQTVMKYDMQNNWFNLNTSDSAPSKNMFARTEWKASTVTTMIPGTLPRFGSKKSEFSKPLAVDESQKKVIDYELDFPKSVELKAKLTGEVNAPELYSFVRDRLFLLPTYASIYKQQLVLNVVPEASSQRTFSYNYRRFFYLPTSPRGQSWASSESSESSESGGFFGYFTGSYAKSSESTSEESRNVESSAARLVESSAARTLFRPQTLGSVLLSYQVSLASISNQKVLNMTLNLTSYTEHDYPATRAFWKFVRPAIPSMPKDEKLQWTDEMTSSVDPSLGQLTQLHKIQWGYESKVDEHKITMTAKFNPTYKDGLCYQENAYGCKDMFGVSYPIWMNHTLDIETVNTDAPQRLRDLIEPYLINSAESVYMYPNQRESRQSDDKMRVELIVRPFESKVDYICSGADFVMNMSRIPASVETKLTNMITDSHYPMSNSVGLSGKDVLPFHHFSGPINEHKDFCTFRDSLFHTLERKVMQKPETDCEILLAGNCDKSNKDFAVSLITDKSTDLPKTLKVQLNEKVLQFDTSSRSGQKVWEVMVDGHKIDIKQGRKSINDNSGKELAVLECSSGRNCQLVCTEKGVFINMNDKLVSIELDTSRTPSICGICAKDSRLPVHINKSEAVRIVKQNVIPGKMCSVREPLAAPRSHCSKLQKHRVVDVVKGSILKCVTAQLIPTCSSSCTTTKDNHKESALAYCLTKTQFNTLHLKPWTEGSETIVEVDSATLTKIQNMGSRDDVQVNFYDKCA
ncbi:vitellogenin-like [Watersipora subatra]|uniref:vitellogenin-like n=1 Tax=Watersipora subatra TaxID=2589382 RepID=UPI00355B55B8